MRVDTITATLFSVALVTSPALAQGVKTVGGAPMYPSKNIVQNAVNSKDHTTLVTAVKALASLTRCRPPARSPSSPRPIRHFPNSRPAQSKTWCSRPTEVRSPLC